MHCYQTTVFMEEEIAILFADLSGYTALTETHGALSAAELIDKFISIVEQSLIPECEFAERTGDEVMIVSKSADCLLQTAISIMTLSRQQHLFLQLHGGLHFGKILKRPNGFFGSTINMAARIASSADTGTFFCSEEFIDAISDKTLINSESRGVFDLKNVTGGKELFEIHVPEKPEYSIDPVCRMIILHKEQALKHPDHDGIYFCSVDCKEKYLVTGTS